MARYAARYVGWYTAGGFVDECGVKHTSNLYYDWPFLSVLNEDEYNTPPGGGVQYTVCWDAWKRAIGKVAPSMTLIGPEIADVNYALYFMNKSHHDDHQPPPVVSTHVWISSPNRSGSFESLFPGVDDWLKKVADPLTAARAAQPETELVMNEFIPENDAWCDRTVPGRSRCYGDVWKWASCGTARPDRETLGWNAAAAAFAYGYGQLAERQWKYVGADQLIGGRCKIKQQDTSFAPTTCSRGRWYPPPPPPPPLIFDGARPMRQTAAVIIGADVRCTDDVIPRRRSVPKQRSWGCELGLGQRGTQRKVLGSADASDTAGNRQQIAAQQCGGLGGGGQW